MQIDIGQLEFIDVMLRDILTSVEIETGWEFTLTSLYRMNDDGVHGTLPLRAADLRVRDGVMGKHLENWINDRWEYHEGSGKHCALLHGEEYNLHLHVQVHPNTVEI